MRSILLSFCMKRESKTTLSNASASHCQLQRQIAVESLRHARTRDLKRPLGATEVSSPGNVIKLNQVPGGSKGK